MKLLDAQEVKTEKSKLEVERIERVHKLNEEESASVKRLNKLKEKEKAEESRLAKESIQYAKSEAELGVQKSVLLSEVKSLEERKQKALEPINLIRKESEQKLEEAKWVVAEAQKFRLSLSKTREDIVERTESLVDQEGLILEKVHDLDRREAGTIAAEAEIRRSTEKLSQDWVKFHEEVYKLNTDLERREKEIENDRKVNEDFKIELSKKEKEQVEKDREIRDKYETLARSIERFNKEKKNHGRSKV